MRLVPDWKMILWKAWSMWAMYLAVVFSGFEALCYIFPEFIAGWLKGWALVATFIVCALAPFLRIKAQKEFDDARS